MDMELTIMNLINLSGEARSLSMEAIGCCKEGKFDKARAMIELAIKKLSEAHRSQTLLIQEEARGGERPVSLLLIHAQDHLMNAITVKDMANEFIELYEVVYEIKEVKDNG